MKKKKLSAEDSLLFRQTIGKVKIIESNTLLLRADKKPKPIPRPPQDDFSEKLKSCHENPTENLTAEDTLSFLAPGVHKNVLKKLRKGDFGADGQLDLHGLTSSQAKQCLLHFLHSCVEEGCRCVHIIHGKGYRSENNHPILKNHLNNWLRQHNDVQAFCSAAPKEGGAGAVLVLLHLAEKYADGERI